MAFLLVVVGDFESPLRPGPSRQNRRATGRRLGCCTDPIRLPRKASSRWNGGTRRSVSAAATIATQNHEMNSLQCRNAMLNVASIQLANRCCDGFSIVIPSKSKRFYRAILEIGTRGFFGPFRTVVVDIDDLSKTSRGHDPG